MGMSDAQFKAYIRAVLLQVKAAREQEDVEKKNEKLDELLASFQQTLED